MVTSERILQVARWTTGVFVAVSVGAAVWMDLEVLAVVVDVSLFAVGCVVFLWAYLRGLGRSREEVVTMGGLFFLGGEVAPSSVVRTLRLLLAVQVVVAIATASVRPFTGLAFGVLVPVFGLAMLALWGALHGSFPVRGEP
jgi:hypothetical protein